MNIIGETIQNGEPSPEHPVEIENKTNILLAEANRQLSLELEKYRKTKDLYYENKELRKTLRLKDKVINEMAKHIHLSGDYECLYEECDDNMDRECEDCIKEYFYKKVKETKDNGSTKKL